MTQNVCIHRLEYCVDEEFEQRIRAVEKDFFNPIRVMYHYNHIYIKHDERYLQKQGYPMKRFLYYLRGILACKWIESNKSLPPVAFKELLDDYVVKPKGKPTLVPKTDKRQAINTAADDFKED